MSSFQYRKSTHLRADLAVINEKHKKLCKQKIVTWSCSNRDAFYDLYTFEGFLILCCSEFTRFKNPRFPAMTIVTLVCSLINRAYTAYAVVLTEVQRVTFITIPHYLLSVVLHGRLESILRYFVNHIR